MTKSMIEEIASVRVASLPYIKSNPMDELPAYIQTLVTESQALAISYARWKRGEPPQRIAVRTLTVLQEIRARFQWATNYPKPSHIEGQVRKLSKALGVKCPDQEGMSMYCLAFDKVCSLHLELAITRMVKMHKFKNMPTPAELLACVVDEDIATHWFIALLDVKLIPQYERYTTKEN